MDAVGISETSVPIYSTTQHHIAEDLIVIFSFMWTIWLNSNIAFRVGYWLAMSENIGDYIIMEFKLHL
jgi:hypothetical protein